MPIHLEIEKMTLEEKLRALGSLWDDLCRREENVPVPQWHKNVLDERQRLLQQGQAEFLDWEDAKRDLRGRRTSPQSWGMELPQLAGTAGGLPEDFAHNHGHYLYLSAREAEKDRKDLNKRLAEISDSRGTLIEDRVEPRGFQLANAIFADEEAHTTTIRVQQRHPSNPSEMMVLDLLAIGPTKILVVEANRRLDAAKAAEYREKLRRLPEFFPELAAKTLCPAVASVCLDPPAIAALNREKLYGIALADDDMEVVNLGQF